MPDEDIMNDEEGKEKDKKESSQKETNSLEPTPSEMEKKKNTYDNDESPDDSDCTEKIIPSLDDIIDDIDEIGKIKDPIEKRERLLSIIRQEIHLESSFRGPLPPPDDFRKYEDTLSGAADRILSMAELALQNGCTRDEHNFEIKKMAIDSSREDNKGTFRLARLVLIIVLIVAILILGFGAYFIYLGKDVAGLSLIIPTLIGGIYGGLKILMSAYKNYDTKEIEENSNTYENNTTTKNSVSEEE
jgi:uncharacterized membrane protein